MRMLRDSSIVCRTSLHALPMINMHPLDEDWYEGITQKLNWTGSLRHGAPSPRAGTRQR
jgi:NAD+ kinase